MNIKKIRMRPEGGDDYQTVLHPETSADQVKIGNTDIGSKIYSVETDLSTHKEDYATQRQQDQLKVATVEKGLNDYKSTIANINVNQEVKQKVTGYGIVSLPKNIANGQVSASVKGLTATNLVKNGDFKTDLSEWIFYKNKATWVNGRAYFNRGESTGSDLITLQQNIKVTNGNKIYMSIDVEHIQVSSDELYGVLNNGGNPQYLFSFTNSALGKSRLSEVFTITHWKHLYINSVPNSEFYLDNIMIIDLTQTFGAGNEPDIVTCDKMFANYFDGTKSTISASRLKSVSKDGKEISTQYLPNVGELRSLPNGTKDEVRVSGGKVEYVKRVSDGKIIDGSDITWLDTTANGDIVSTSITTVVGSTPWFDRNEFNNKTSNSGSPNFGYYISSSGCLKLTTPKGTYVGLVDAQTKLTGLEITYQLAQEVVTPIQISGNLISYPSGTVYVENVVADAGVYTTKFDIKELQLPIKSIDKLIKYNFTTGVQTVLDASLVVINTDKKSFTHPNLINKDMVFVDYFYDVEGTLGETTIEYYDSRYTIKDTTNNKFYSWNIKSTNGVPTVALTEVL